MVEIHISAIIRMIRLAGTDSGLFPLYIQEMMGRSVRRSIMDIIMKRHFVMGIQNQCWLKFRRKRLMKMERYRIRTRLMKQRRKMNVCRRTGRHV